MKGREVTGSQSAVSGRASCSMFNADVQIRTGHILLTFQNMRTAYRIIVVAKFIVILCVSVVLMIAKA